MNEESGILKLLEQIKNGDESAFAEFYSQTYKYVYSRAKCMFSDEEEVQDLVQEVYLALYRNVTTIQSGESIFGWLKTTTFYQGTKMLKKRRKEVLLSEDGEEMFETIPDDEPEIEEGYMNQEDVEVIRECINRLSDEQKTVLLAYYYDNLKVNEIADILSLSAGTVKSRLYLARKNLQVHIEEEEKKRGYKLHSFGAVTLALALRMFLQGNMEVAGSAEETIFARLCQDLNIGIGKAASTQGGIAEQAPQEGTRQVTQEGAKQVTQEGVKQAGKGPLGKLGALGAKKIAVSAVGIIAAATIGGVVIGGLNKEEKQPQEPVQMEEEKEEKDTQDNKLVSSGQWQIDYAKILLKIEYTSDEAIELFASEDILLRSSDYGWSFWIQDMDADKIPELYVKAHNHITYEDKVYVFTSGNSMEQCFGGQMEYTEHSTDTYYIREQDISEALGVNIGEQEISLLTRIASSFRDAEDITIMEICFSDDNIPDYILQESTSVDIVYSNDGDYKVTRIGGQAAPQATYAEGKGRWIHHIGSLCRVYENSLPVYEFNKKQDASNPNGIVYLYSNYLEENVVNMELTEEEYNQKYNEICGNEKELYSDIQYKRFDEFLSSMEITSKEEGM